MNYSKILAALGPVPLAIVLATALGMGNCRRPVGETAFDPTGMWDREDPAVAGGKAIGLKVTLSAGAGKRTEPLPICEPTTPAGTACFDFPLIRYPYGIRYDRVSDMEGNTALVEPPADSAMTLPTGYSSVGAAAARSCTRPFAHASQDPACLAGTPCSAGPASCLTPEPRPSSVACPDGQIPGPGRACDSRALRQFGFPRLADLIVGRGAATGSCKLDLQIERTGYFYSNVALDLQVQLKLVFVSCESSAQVQALMAEQDGRGPSLRQIMARAGLLSYDSAGELQRYSRESFVFAKYPLRRTSTEVAAWVAPSVPTACGSNWRFGALPVDPETFPAISGLGVLAGAHVFPVRHSYFSPWLRSAPSTNPESRIRSFDFRAPGDIVITRLDRWTHRYKDSSGRVTDFNVSYNLQFEACDGVSGYIIYLGDDPNNTDDIGSIASAANLFTGPCVDSNPENSGSYFCIQGTENLRLSVRQGTRLGVVGSPFTHYAVNGGPPQTIQSGVSVPPDALRLGGLEVLDFGLIDRRADADRPACRTLAGGAQLCPLPPGTTRANGFSPLRESEYPHTVCSWAYFPDSAINRLWERRRLGSERNGVSGVHPITGPYGPCGTALQEVSGKLQGLWAQVSPRRTFTQRDAEVPHLALVRDPSDSAAPTVSWGSAFNRSFASTQCPEFVYNDSCAGNYRIGASDPSRPNASRINVPFQDVSLPGGGLSTTVHCYDRFVPTSTAPGNEAAYPDQGRVPFRLFLQMSSVSGSPTVTLHAILERRPAGETSGCDRGDWPASLVGNSRTVTFVRDW